MTERLRVQQLTLRGLGVCLLAFTVISYGWSWALAHYAPMCGLAVLAPRGKAARRVSAGAMVVWDLILGWASPDTAPFLMFFVSNSGIVPIMLAGGAAAFFYEWRRSETH